MLSEISHSQKHKYCMIPLMYEVFKIVKFIGTKLHGGCRRLVGGKGKWERSLAVQWLQSFSHAR